MRIRRMALVATLVGLLGVGASMEAPPSEAAWVPTGYYLIAHSGEIWAVDQAAGTAHAIDYPTWAAAGFPQPRPAPTKYVKYPWSSSITADTQFADEYTPGREAITHLLTYQEWLRAGSPAPELARWINPSTVYKWQSGPEVFIENPDGSHHKLSHDEWAYIGNHSPRIDGEGVYKVSWDSMIYVSSGTGCYSVGYDWWRAHDFPTPLVVQRIPGDRVYQLRGSSTLYYNSSNRPITYAEWAALGFPAPVVY